ncbi:MAG: CPBP family intramembrane metalloprotease [Anaerolineae bacterium]|jgi:membrane protease YdiL (CAAX protease family)|nr:CPBP family intramembrane metalloprotease [Anaerolineae bacterium]MDH7474500.1 CPBP family intramembrane metalloprotease [Anaerolineae bacterium]
MSIPGFRRLLLRVFTKDGRLHPLWRACFYLMTYVAVTLVIQISVVFPYFFYKLILGASPTDIGRALLGGPSPSVVECVLIVLELLTALGITYLFRRFLDRASFVSLGFRRRNLGTDIAFGVLLGLVLMAGIFFAEWGSGLLIIERAAWNVEPLAVIMGNLVISLPFFIAVAVHEEVVFRGYLVSNLAEGMDKVVAVMVSSLVFGAFHVLNPHASLIAIVNIALAGVVFAYAYLSSGNLWLPIAFHFSWNFFQGPVFSLPVSGIVMRSPLVIHPRPGFDLITGGAFGPEAGLSGFVALVLAWAGLGLWSRARTT